MTIYHEKIMCMTAVHHPTFVDITEDVKKIVENSKVMNGQLLVYSPHTTCSVVTQEPSRGTTFNGTLFIHQDLVNALAKIVPTCEYEGQYLHPSLEHRGRAEAIGEDASWSLNTDAHIRSEIIGRSVTIPVIEGEVQLGRFGHIFFIDWDQVRARERGVIVQIMGE